MTKAIESSPWLPETRREILSSLSRKRGIRQMINLQSVALASQVSSFYGPLLDLLMQSISCRCFRTSSSLSASFLPDGSYTVTCFSSQTERSCRRTSRAPWPKLLGTRARSVDRGTLICNELAFCNSFPPSELYIHSGRTMRTTSLRILQQIQLSAENICTRFRGAMSDFLAACVEFEAPRL